MKIILILCLFIYSINACNILVLSGGGAHGAFEAGVLKKLDMMGKRWDIITGISVGSLNGLMLAMYDQTMQTYALKQLEDMWINLTNEQVYIKNWDPVWDKSLYNNAPLNNTVYTTIMQNGKTIKREFIIGATSLNTGELHIFDKHDMTNAKNILDFVMGSASIPIYFPPRFFMNNFYLDGGTFSNELVIPAFEYCNKFNKSISIDVILPANLIEKIENKVIQDYTIFGMTDRAYNLMSNALFNHQLYSNCVGNQTRYPMNIYMPDKPFTGGLMDFEKKYLKYSFDMGYNVTKPLYVDYCI